MKGLFFGILLLILCVIIYLRPLPSSPAFYVPKQEKIPSSSKILFESELIPQPSLLLFSHSASLTILKNGDLLAVWFAGSDEGADDVKIWQSRYHNGVWSMAHAIISAESISKDTKRYVRKLGNPVIYRAVDGTLHLYVVTAIGGWAASSLNTMLSYDEGKTWQPSRRLRLTPFFDLSTLCRTTPVTLLDEGYYLPVYHESIRDYPELLRFDRKGNFIEQIRMNDHNGLLQPSVVPLTKNKACAFFRNNGDAPRYMYREDTYDGGLTWGSLKRTNLMNPNASIVAIEALPGEFLMVYNSENRGKLVLGVSKDGLNWREIYTLEYNENDSYCYPAVVMKGDVIDVLYSWKKEKIKHVRFNLAWLKSRGF